MKSYQLKITLKHSKPPIWRQILVPGDISFQDLHLMIQSVFNWQNGHLYEFRLNDTVLTDFETLDEPMDGKDSRKEKIFSYLKKEKQRFRYLYDFGDDWDHEIVVERILPKWTGKLPLCVGASQMAPLEDFGGIDGWYDLLEKFKNVDFDSAKNDLDLEFYEWICDQIPELRENGCLLQNNKHIDVDALNDRLQDWKSMDVAED